MNLLSLDLSIASTGYSVHINNEIVECDRIVTKGEDRKSSKTPDGYTHFFSSSSEDKRIYYLCTIIDELSKKYNITDYCIEDQFIGCNPKTGLTLSKVKGAVIYIGMNNNINIHHMKPTEVRKYLMGTGRGNASKQVVANYIRDNYYDVGEFEDKYNKKKSDDKYDAMACGIALLSKLEKEKVC